MNKASVENITYSNRVVRTVVGLGLIFSVGLQSGPLGIAAILPLIAIYPIMTGVLGWDPIAEYFAVRKPQAVKTLQGSIGSPV